MSCEKKYQALSHFSVLIATESWVGPGNEATPHYTLTSHSAIIGYLSLVYTPQTAEDRLTNQKCRVGRSHLVDSCRPIKVHWNLTFREFDWLILTFNNTFLNNWFEIHGTSPECKCGRVAMRWSCLEHSIVVVSLVLTLIVLPVLLLFVGFTVFQVPLWTKVVTWYRHFRHACQSTFDLHNWKKGVYVGIRPK